MPIRNAPATGNKGLAGWNAASGCASMKIAVASLNVPGGIPPPEYRAEGLDARVRTARNSGRTIRGPAFTS